jgi:hypothetical protein
MLARTWYTARPLVERRPAERLASGHSKTGGPKEWDTAPYEQVPRQRHIPREVISSASSPFRLFVHVIDNDHGYGPRLLHQLEAQLLFDCVKHRYAHRVGRTRHGAGRLIRIW